MAIWWDLRARRVPNIVNALIALAGVTAQVCLFDGAGLSSALAGVLVSGIVMAIPFQLRVYRGGDAKLMMATGAWLGPVTAPWALLLGAALGGLVAVVMVLTRPPLRALIQDGDSPISARPKSAHVPMALAFGAATAASLWIPAPWQG